MLAKSESLKASDLARLCDVSRMDAYRILRRLQDKGIVEAVMSRPMKFQAIPPEKTFDTLLKSASEKLLSMKSEKNYLLSLWPTQPIFEEEKKEAEKLRVIQGRVEFSNTLRRAVRSAHKEIIIVTTKNGLSRLFHTAFDKDLEEKDELGISIRILSKVIESETEAVEKFASVANLRHLNNLLAIQIIVIDGQQAIVSTSLDDSMSLTSEKDTSIWTNSRDQISVLETLFEELWNNSLSLKEARQIIDTGIPPPKFQKVIGKDNIYALEQEILRSATNTITILARSITNSLILKADCMNLLVAAAEKGTEVRVMTNLKEENSEMLEDIYRQLDLKVTNIEPSLDILTVDKTNTIAIKIYDVSHLPVLHEAFYINEQTYTNMMDKLLVEVWAKAENAAMVLKSRVWVEHIKIVLQRSAEVLNKRGYSVEIPGILKGSSSLQHTYDLVARTKKNSGFVVVEHQTSSQTIIPFYVKVADCGVNKAIIVSPPDFKEESIKLASFLGITTIKVSSTGDDHLKIVEAVETYFLAN